MPQQKPARRMGHHRPGGHASARHCQGKMYSPGDRSLFLCPNAIREAMPAICFHKCLKGVYNRAKGQNTPMFPCSSIGVRATLDAFGSPRDDSMSGVRIFHLYSSTGSWSLLVMAKRDSIGPLAAHNQVVLTSLAQIEGDSLLSGHATAAWIMWLRSALPARILPLPSQ
jgi:hypothetical protein